MKDRLLAIFAPLPSLVIGMLFFGTAVDTVISGLSSERGNPSKFVLFGAVMGSLLVAAYVSLRILSSSPGKVSKRKGLLWDLAALLSLWMGLVFWWFAASISMSGFPERSSFPEEIVFLLVAFGAFLLSSSAASWRFVSRLRTQ